MREFDAITLRGPFAGHTVGEAGTIVDLDGEVAFVEFANGDVISMNIARLRPVSERAAATHAA